MARLSASAQGDVLGSDWNAVEFDIPADLAQSVTDGGDDRWGHGDAGRFANTFGAERSEGVRLFDQRRQHCWHVEHGGQQIVGEAGVSDRSVDLDDFLHHRQAETLGNTAFDLAKHGEGIQGDADILGGSNLNHFDQPKIGVDINDRTVGHKGERRMAVALPVLVQLGRLRMAVFGGLLEHDA